MSIRCRVIVHGHVQGVGFRVFVAQAARTRGVAGSVRNRPDGAVEVVLEGPSESVESIVRLCREGPRAAQVERVEVIPEPPRGPRGFDVR